jgi:hypothetical protein
MDRKSSRCIAGARQYEAGSGLPEALVALLLLAVGLLAGASGLLRAVRGSESALRWSGATLQTGEFAERARLSGWIGGPGRRPAPLDDWEAATVSQLPHAAARLAEQQAQAPGTRSFVATVSWDDPDGHRPEANLAVTLPVDDAAP